MASNSSPIPKNEPLIKGIRLAFKPKEEAAAKDDQEHEEEAKVDRERSTHTVARKIDDSKDNAGPDANQIKEINFDLDRPLKCALSDVFNTGGSLIIAAPDISYAQVSY